MSKPTIIMITHAAGDEGIEQLNGSLVDRVGIYGRLTRVDSLAPSWDGHTAVHLGSFNHLDEPLFMKLVREAGWAQPDQLQVFIEREDDVAFTEYDLFDQIVPRRIAHQAVGRGLNLSASPEQRAFFARLASVRRDSSKNSAIDDVSTISPWLFEVVAIYPSYYFESNARVVPYDNHTAIDTNRNCVSPVDLAFGGVGVRWGNRDPDVIDSATDVARRSIETLSPGDIVETEGLVCPGPGGIVELQQVRSLCKRT